MIDAETDTDKFVAYFLAVIITVTVIFLPISCHYMGKSAKEREQKEYVSYEEKFNLYFPEAQNTKRINKYEFLFEYSQQESLKRFHYDISKNKLTQLLD